MKLCDYDTSKALQELGYDGEYDVLPRLDDAAYFLRDRFQIDIAVHRSWAMSNSYYYTLVVNNDYEHIDQQPSIPNRSYEQSLLDAVTEGVKIAKQLLENKQ